MKKTILCIFALIFLFSGCAEKAISEQDKTPQVSGKSATSTILPEPDNEQNESPETSSESDVSQLSPELGTGKSKNVEEVKTATNNEAHVSGTDANAFLLSAPVRGQVSALTSTEFVVGDAFASTDSVSTGSYVVNYNENTIFKYASIKANGSTYSVYDAEPEKLVEGAFVMVFGDDTTDGGLNATEIVVVEFDYS